MNREDFIKLSYAISILEDSGNFDQAGKLHDFFLKEAAKKKSKKKKNVPNNPSLWAECKAWAKRTFDVYPCVPLDSFALTKNGWAEYNELNIGDEILTYNQNIDKLEWKPILNLHFYEDAPTLKMSKAQTNFKIRCTPDHKWVLKTPNVKYPTNLVEAKNITKRMVLKTAAEVVDDVNVNLDLSDWRKGDDWIKNVLSMSKPQLETFFASGIVYDGYDKGKSSLNRSTYGFSQKNINHGLAMEIAAVLLGYRVSFKEKLHNSDMISWTFIKRDSESTGNLAITEDENCDVWCPETENNTWVMKQGNIITITGNSAYANGAAARRYKSKGGTWRKASIDNIRIAQNLNNKQLTKAEQNLVDYITKVMKQYGPPFSSRTGKAVPPYVQFLSPINNKGFMTIAPTTFSDGYIHDAESNSPKSNWAGWSQIKKMNFNLPTYNTREELDEGRKRIWNALNNAVNNIVRENPNYATLEKFKQSGKTPLKVGPEISTIIQKNMTPPKSSVRNLNEIEAKPMGLSTVGITNNSEPSLPTPTLPTYSEEISDYYDKDYTTVIKAAKMMLQEGKDREAKNLIDAVVQNNNIISPADKNALKAHFDRISDILFSQGTFVENKITPTSFKRYEVANDFFKNTLEKLGLKDSDLTDDYKYMQVYRAIKNAIMRPIEKNMVYELLRRTQMDEIEKKRKTREDR